MTSASLTNGLSDRGSVENGCFVLMFCNEQIVKVKQILRVWP